MSVTQCNYCICERNMYICRLCRGGDTACFDDDNKCDRQGTAWSGKPLGGPTFYFETSDVVSSLCSIDYFWTKG
jgi:hypothetical protein